MKKEYIEPQTDVMRLTGMCIMQLGNTSMHAPGGKGAPEKRTSVF